MEPTAQEIHELREKFQQKISEENKDFHPKDVERAATDDKWLGRFLVHNQLSIEAALNMMIDTCEWRKNNKVNEINETNLNPDYLNVGGLFLHGRDRDGKSLLVFNCRKHVKGQKDMEELKRLIIYWMERAERLDKGEKVTIFFDMADTGLSNMDMEYIKYIINLFKLYYPNFLNYIIIFEMPWIMNAAFKVIKSWLPAQAVQLIKFLDRKSIKDYVDTSQALTSWGGENTYEYVFLTDTPDGKSEENKKKNRVPIVLFLEGEEISSSYRCPRDHYDMGRIRFRNGTYHLSCYCQGPFLTIYAAILDQVHFADGSNFNDSPINTYGDQKMEDSSNSRTVLSPSDAICFIQDGVELSGNLTITNTSTSPVIYKVKTTSPEKFRVRPSLGQLSAGGGQAHIQVHLLSGYTGTSILRDKFLVMTFPIEQDSSASQDLNELWKANCSDSKKLEEHKLRCRVAGLQSCPPNGLSLQSAGSLPLSPASDIEQKISQLLIAMNHSTEVNTKLQSRVLFLQRLMLLTVTLLLIVLMILVLPRSGGCPRGSAGCDFGTIGQQCHLGASSSPPPLEPPLPGLEE